MTVMQVAYSEKLFRPLLFPGKRIDGSSTIRQGA